MFEPTDYKKLFAEVSKKVLEEFPKTSYLRRMGQLYKLELGEVAILETDSALHLDSSGRATATLGVDKICLGETQLVADVKVFATTRSRTANAIEQATEKLVGIMKHKEQGVIADLLADAIFVPKADYYRVRRFFRDLERPGVLIPQEHIEDYLKQNLVTMVRLDLSANWISRPEDMHASIAVHEVIAPAVVQGDWVPGTWKE